MNKFELVKTGVSIVASSCVGVVIKEVINKFTPNNLSKMKKIGMGIGTFVIADYASTKINAYVEDQFKAIKNALDSVKNYNKDMIEIESVEVEEK